MSSFPSFSHSSVTVFCSSVNPRYRANARTHVAPMAIFFFCVIPFFLSMDIIFKVHTIPTAIAPINAKVLKVMLLNIQTSEVF